MRGISRGLTRSTSGAGLATTWRWAMARTTALVQDWHGTLSTRPMALREGSVPATIDGQESRLEP